GQKEAPAEGAAARSSDGDFGIAGDLAVAAFAAQLHAHLVEEAVAVEASGGELPAVGVDRDLAVARDALAALDERAAFALLQKPSASSHASVMKLKPSYSSATSTSAGVRSVRCQSMAAASRSAMVVMSSHWSHDGRP